MNRILPALLGAILFSSLCFQQEIGLNILLIAVATSGLIIYDTRTRVPWFCLGAYLYTALFSFLYPWPGAILMHLLSLVVLAGAHASPSSPVYLKGFLGGTNLLLGMLIGLVTGRKNAVPDQKRSVNSTGAILGGIGLSAFLLFIFTSLYADSNPLFETLVDRIDLSFISLGWFWLTVLGFLLYFNLLNAYDPSRVERADKSFSDLLKVPEKPFGEKRLRSLGLESLWGKMALWSLNSLLLFYLILDWIYLGQNGVGSPALQSQAVHEGVNALIFSIVLAMGILLLVFRGDLNFYQGNRWLYRLSMAWLGFNSLLLGNTLLKNAMYVHYSGLTFKRAGVFLFLILAGIGLITVFLKLRDKKTLAYLVRCNSLAAFIVLVGLLSLPWTPWITAYNLNRIERPDVEYLLTLPRQNAPQLQRFARSRPERLTSDQKVRIEQRYHVFSMEQENRNWREFTAYHLLNGW